MIQNWDSVLQGRYVPLWKQTKADERRKPAVFVHNRVYNRE